MKTDLINVLHGQVSRAWSEGSYLVLAI